MIALVITGGQTGADQGGWRAAKAAGIPTGGYMPLDFMTEAGPRPEFAELYGAKEWPELCLTLGEQYVARTRANVRDADFTLWFGESGTPGYRCTLAAASRVADARKLAKSPFHNCFWGHDRNRYDPATTAWMIVHDKIRVLNVAGNRESKAPGIGAFVERYLSEVFRLLREAGEPVALGRPSVTPSPSASPAAPPHPEDDEERS